MMDNKTKMKVGMSETDNRRHYYFEQMVSKTESYFIRYCDWTYPDSPVVILDIPADCKRCLRKKVE